MASPNYSAYSPAIVFVDDVGGAGGTALIAANYNGLRNDLATYVENHINGTANVHSTVDIYDATLPETTAYANLAATNYGQAARNDMFATILKEILGSTGTLTARIATFLGNSGSDLNSLWTTIGGATALATNLAIVKRDATGGAAFAGTLTAANGTLSGTLSVTGLITATAGVSGTATSASALAAPVALTTLVSDYKASTNASAGVITIAAGGAYQSSTGVIVGPLGQQTVTLPTQPTGTNTQYVGISLGPAAGAPVVTAAAVNAPLSTLVMPTGNKPIAVVLWRGATTLPSGIVAASDIIDIRNLGGGGGTGSGGGGIAVTDTVVSIGALGDDSAAQDLFPLALGTAGSATVGGHRLDYFRVSPYRIGFEDPAVAANAGTFGDLFYHAKGGMAERPQDFIAIVGNTITLSPNNIAANVVFPNGIAKINRTAKAHTITNPPAGYTPYFIVADCTGVTDGTFDIIVTTTLPTATLTNLLLGIAVNNGSVFTGVNYAAFKSLLQVSSTQMVPITESYAGAPAQSYTAGTPPVPIEVTAATKILQFPDNMKLQVQGALRISAVAGVRVFAQMFIDGIALGVPADFGLNLPTAYDITQPIGGTFGDSSSIGAAASLGAGAHTLKVVVTPYTAGQTFIAQSVWWNSVQWGVFS